MDLSIILPSIYPARVKEFHGSIAGSCESADGKSVEWELIVVGPRLLDEELSRTRFVQDWGNVSRCVQLGSMFARGKYLTWNSDDALLEPHAYYNCYSLFEDELTEGDGIVIRYFEAPNREGQLPSDDYWEAWTHADQRLPGIPKHYKCCPVGMYRASTWRELGGTDCRFMHQNLNSHDFAYRIQYNGGEMHLSPDCVMRCGFDNTTNKDHTVLDVAYAQNDRPLFNSIYSDPNALLNRQVSYLNWMDQPAVWQRYNQ